MRDFQQLADEAFANLWLGQFQARPECSPVPRTAFSDFQPKIHPHDLTKTPK
jgi:hypothetical protein